MGRSETITLDGMEIEVEEKKPLPGGGARIDVEQGGRRWRLDVSQMGDVDEVVTTWENGQLADVEPPDWIDDVVARLAAPV